MEAVVDRARAHGPVLAVVFFATVWTVLAFRSPTSTYHFAPLVVGAAWPAVARVIRGVLSAGEATRASIGGLVSVALVTFDLSILNALQGPGFFGLSPEAEAMVIGTIGTVAAGLWSRWPTELRG